jgi:hypothetical protein
MEASDAPHGWDRYPSLRKGPAASSREGRIQRQVRRAFAAAGTNTITTSVAYDYALAERRHDEWRMMERCSVLRALDQVADRVGKDPRYGAIIWRLRSPVADAPSAPSD